jgi:hypothetical protein
MTLTDGEKLIFAAAFVRAEDRAWKALDELRLAGVVQAQDIVLVGRVVTVGYDTNPALIEALGASLESVLPTGPDITMSWIKKYALVEAVKAVSVYRGLAETVATLFDEADPPEPEYREVLSQIFDITPPE